MTEPIRVLRVIARVNVGGPAVQIAALSRGLDRASFEQRLLTGMVEEGEADLVELRAPDLPIVRLPQLGRRVRPLDDVRALAAIAEHIRAFRPHIVHTHTAKAGVLGRIAALRAGVPTLVHTFHGHLLHGYYGPAVTAGIRVTERALARRTTVLVAVGEQVRDDLLAARIGRREQYEIVPPGVDMLPRPPRAEARDRLGLPATGHVVVFVARLTQIKRPDRMLDVAAALAVTGATFAVVGEGPLLPDLKKEVTARGLSNVRFLGWRADVEIVYAAADAVLLTSDNEGTPVALIEAALCGVPAVATNVGSVREVVRDGISGYVVTGGAADLARALRDLLADEAVRARMGAAAAAHAEARYGASRLVDDMDRLYRSLVQR